jgi:hypothetical protein
MSSFISPAVKSPKCSGFFLGDGVDIVSVGSIFQGMSVDGCVFCPFNEKVFCCAKARRWVVVVKCGRERMRSAVG